MSFLFLKRGILNDFFRDNYLTADLLLHVPTMYNTFIMCQRNLTRVLFWTLVALTTDTYRGNIRTIDRVVFRSVDGIFFLFFFVSLFAETFVKRTTRRLVSFYKTNFVLQVARSHLLPEHLTLVSLEHAHVFTAVFIR